ncbi:MAG: NUDIX domain-containing protein [Oscillospiraceae bacterium]|nr:NUDIX domain-containing protein [Oscillospiraceae bacterium]
MADMPLLAVYHDRNYDPTWPRHMRHAVRCIIRRGSKVALVKSTVKGFYQFPGGGIDPGESHEHALIRETLEETGLDIIPDSIRPFGITREIRASQIAAETIFDHTSYFYFADVAEEAHEQVLEDYERDLGYTLEWADIRQAAAVNRALSPKYEHKTKFLLREADILTLLAQHT